MLDRLLELAPLLSATMAALSALVWIVYLNAFLSSYRRQQRPSLLITSGGGRGLDAHCLVTNLGLEPVYLLDVVLDLDDEDEQRTRAIIPERNERWPQRSQADEDETVPATNVGPLRSGEEKDLGRFRTLIDRACTENPQIDRDRPLRALDVMIVAITAGRTDLCGARRRYRLVRADDTLHLHPTTLKARQLQGFFARRMLTRVLSAHLQPDT